MVVTSRAFETFLPQFPVILAIAVALFAFSTLITWSYYTMKAWTTLFGRSPRSELTFKIVFCLFTVVGTVMAFTSVLTFADSMLFLCAIVNLFACYLLLPKVREELRELPRGPAHRGDRRGPGRGARDHLTPDGRGRTRDPGASAPTRPVRTPCAGPA